MRRLLLITAVILPAIVSSAPSLAQQGRQKRNPFAPLAEPAIRKITKIAEQADETGASYQLKLNGIIWNKNSPMAIINDTVVELGSEIAGRKVCVISNTHVELEYYDKRKTLKITPRILFAVTSKNQKPNPVQNRVTK